MHDIFISYSHDDKITADAICAKLEREGIRCWYAPRDAEFGDAWAGSIVNAIRNTKAMILVFTEFSNASVQVRKEVTIAVNNSKTIIPYRATNTMPTDSMEYLLCDLHWLDAYNESMDASLNSLLERVRAIVPHEAKESKQEAVEKPIEIKVENKGKEYGPPLNNIDALCDMLAKHEGETYKTADENKKVQVLMAASRILAVAKGFECEFRPIDSFGRVFDWKSLDFWRYCPAMRAEQIRILEGLGWTNGTFRLKNKPVPLDQYCDLGTYGQDREEILLEERITDAEHLGYELYLPLNEQEMKQINEKVNKIIDQAKSRNELFCNMLPYLGLPGMEERYEEALDVLEIKIDGGLL